MADLSKKVVLITGASRGIGEAVALTLAGASAKVIINYVGGRDAAEATVNKIKQQGGDAIALQADISKSEEVKKLFDAAIAHYGRIDVLVNNAGIMITKLIKDTTDDDFTHQFDINVRGTFNTMREAATKLADNGTVINFSSSNNRLILPGYSTYATTKSAVEQLTRVFSKEVGARNINVNSISPGPTNTELFMKGKPQSMIDFLASLSPFNRIGEPSDIAELVLFLASDEAKWVNAQNFGINGGIA